MNKWTLYILESLSVSGKIYIGSTANLEKRLLDHNRGGTPSTKPYLPWKVFYTETYATKSEAVKRELQLKRWKNRERINVLISKNLRP